MPLCPREFWSLDEYVSASLAAVMCGMHSAVCLFCFRASMVCHTCECVGISVHLVTNVCLPQDKQLLVCAHVCVWHSLADLSDVCYILLETRRSPGPSPVPTFLCALCYKKIFAFSTTHNFSSSITTRCELCGPRPHGNRGSSSCGSLLWRLPWELALLQAQRGWGIPGGERRLRGTLLGAGAGAGAGLADGRDWSPGGRGRTGCAGMCPRGGCCKSGFLDSGGRGPRPVLRHSCTAQVVRGKGGLK